MSDFQKWSVLAFRAMDDAGRVLMTIEPESTTEGERLDQLKETIRELLTQCVLLNGLCTRRQLDERFGFGKLDTDALNVQLGQQQADPVAQRSDGMPISKMERELRRMLCIERHGRSAYMDDGEASFCGDKYCRSIDYMRESVESIKQAWYDAAVKKLAGAQLKQQAEPVVDEAIHAAWSAGFVEGEKAALEHQAEPPTCEWSPEDDDTMPGTYRSACGELWSFIDGGWKDNRVNFCHGCGSKVVEASSGIQETKS